MPGHQYNGHGDNHQSGDDAPEQPPVSRLRQCRCFHCEYTLETINGHGISAGSILGCGEGYRYAIATIQDDLFTVVDPVECIAPQGAIYLSLRLDLIGRELNGESIETNEAIRKLLLERAGLAVIPFQAFGLEEDTGWFRISVGAVSPEEIDQAFPRLRDLLDGFR